MPNVNPSESSTPPASGSGEGPQPLNQAPDPGLPEQQSGWELVEVSEVENTSEQLNTGAEKTSGEGELSCNWLRNKDVLKGISISSTAFIGPACRPQPAFENELNEFYKELEQIEQLDSADGNNGSVSQCCAPTDTVDGSHEHVHQFWSPQDGVDRIGHSERVSQSRAAPVNSMAIKETENDYRNSYRPYSIPWPQTDYRNTPPWRPPPYDTGSSWSNPQSLYQNQWQLPPPNAPFYPPPQPGNPAHHPTYSQPQGHQYSQLAPDIRFTSPRSHASCAPYQDFDRWQYQEGNQHKHSDQTSLVLILMRGVPGCGKSTLAQQISSRGPSGLILSTDDYFYQDDGYYFEPSLLGAAHNWNQNRAEQAMLENRTPVIIDNTNIQAWEMKPYVMMALDMGYQVEFVEPDTSWKCDPVELEKRNHHGVPRESIVNMLDRFELPISVDIVMNSCEPSHKRRENQSRPYRYGR